MSLLLLLKPKVWFWNITAADVDGILRKRGSVEIPAEVAKVAEVETALKLPAVIAQQYKAVEEEEALLLLLLSD